MAKVGINKKEGFIDKRGKEIIAIKYDYTEDYIEDYDSNYSKGLIFVVKDNKQGLIDISGKVVLDVKYDFISKLIGNTILLQKDGKISVLTIK